jgi:hypothetical protein
MLQGCFGLFSRYFKLCFEIDLIRPLYWICRLDTSNVYVGRGTGLLVTENKSLLDREIVCGLKWPFLQDNRV